jgi:Flp pilus assembly protein TadG
VIRRLRRLGRDKSGATAIEFALLAGPFLLIVLGLIEIGIQYFTSTSFESAVQRTARLIRTGQAQTASMDLPALRKAVCDDIYNLFDCMNNTAFQVSILSSMTSVPTDAAVDEDGKFVLEEDFNAGKGSDYVLVRGYFQFHPLLDVFGVIRHRLANGNYLYGATVLFRNEPF